MGREEFINAVKRGDSKLIRAALDAEPALVDSQTWVGGAPAVLVALRERQYEAARILVSYGAELDVRFGRQRGTCLASAVVAQDAEAVRLLLEGGADPNIGSDTGRTPLIWAIHLKREDLADLLLLHGANGLTVQGVESPLEAARAYSLSNTVERILKGQRGTTPEPSQDAQ